MRKNAKLYRNALRGLVAALALGGLQVAHAGYAQLASPSGYASTSGGHTYAASAANDKVFGKVIHQPNALSTNVGGQAVKMPAAYRLAANAPRIAAAAIYLNPYVRTGVAIAAWLGVGKFVWDEASKQWTKTTDKEELFEAFEYSKSGNDIWFPSANEACADWVSRINGGGGFYTSGGSATGLTCNYRISVNQKDWFPDSTSLDKRAVACPAGWTLTPAGCLLKTSEVKTVTQKEFEDALAPSMPDNVPLELPPNTPLPVEQPYINPDPGGNPSNKPLRVPTGNPSPIPNTNPQQYSQPYVDIVPAPTPDQPFRVDIKPGETTSTSPNPIESPNPDSQDAPKPEEQQSLCEKHPDILACQKPELDTPDGEIPKTTKQVTYAEEGGFGDGSCPANLYSNIGGENVMVYNWAETCGVVSTYLRPIILLLGAMGALFILIPGRDS